MSDIDPIEKAAQSPQRARTAAGEVEAHKLAEQIAAAKYLAAKRVTNPFLALRVGTFVPPGALGDYPEGQ
jgi:hypothetical protein